MLSCFFFLFIIIVMELVLIYLKTFFVDFQYQSLLILISYQFNPITWQQHLYLFHRVIYIFILLLFNLHPLLNLNIIAFPFVFDGMYLSNHITYLTQICPVSTHILKYSLEQIRNNSVRSLN